MCEDSYTHLFFLGLGKTLAALANVEQWAVDTALDNMARFGFYTGASAGTLSESQIVDNGQEQEFTMPNRFFDDFVQMACDESKVREHAISYAVLFLFIKLVYHRC
jgi:uncharacterized ferritin-like protein (DUF455 family)